MSATMDDIDKQLLGEQSDNEDHPTMTGEGTAADPSNKINNNGFHPINAKAGTLVKVDSEGNEISEQDTNKAATEIKAKTSPKKRGAAAAANDVTSQPAKKRASPVKKGKATTQNGNDEPTEPTTPTKRANNKNKISKPAIENEVTKGDEENCNTAANGADTTGPVTPKNKRSPKKAKAATTKMSDTGDSKTAEEWDAIKDEDDEATPIQAKSGKASVSVSPSKSATFASSSKTGGETTVRDTPRKRSAAKGPLAQARGIPTSWDTAGDADKMLVTMKEEGNDWGTIRAAWKEATGQDSAPSTLPNRYNRIKVNMMRLKEGDAAHLLAAKAEVEKSFETEKWSYIVKKMEQLGADTYPTAFLHKKWKELHAQGSLNGGGEKENTVMGAAEEEEE